jgi:hypothetical protein
MKRAIGYLLFLLFLVSCGTDSSHFKIEGRFRNLNQGEFYVYSPDGGTSQLDTIKVQDGSFAYEVPLEKKATFIIVFPNFSEQAIFGEPGKTATVKGDASHLKEMEVSGNTDNELMTKFRLSVLHNSDNDIRKNIVNFVNDHPESIVGIYLVNKYFVRSAEPDYKKAVSLFNVMAKKQKDNGMLRNLSEEVDGLSKTMVNSTLPHFSAINTNGVRISDSNYSHTVTIINVWASWNFESIAIQRQLQSLKKKYGGRLSILGINLDPSKKMCTDATRMDSIKWDNVCDEQMWDSQLLKELGLGTIPDNIMIGRDGKIIARGLDSNGITSKLQSILK